MKTAVIWAPIAQEQPRTDFPEFTNDVQTTALSEEEEEADLSARLSRVRFPLFCLPLGQEMKGAEGERETEREREGVRDREREGVREREMRGDALPLSHGNKSRQDWKGTIHK